MLFQAYFDGSFNEKTLCGGIGIVILEDGKILEALSYPLHNAHPGDVEVLALRKSIERLLYYNARQIQIFGDDRTLILGFNKMCQKFYSIKEEDVATRFLEHWRERSLRRVLMFEALETFDKYELIVIGSKFNALADFLSKNASGACGLDSKKRQRVRKRVRYIRIPVRANNSFQYFWRPVESLEDPSFCIQP